MVRPTGQSCMYMSYILVSNNTDFVEMGMLDTNLVTFWQILSASSGGLTVRKVNTGSRGCNMLMHEPQTTYLNPRLVQILHS
jgi:hypothetical protein